MPVLESHRQLINDAILNLGIDPAICQQDNNPNLWKLHRGKAQIIIVAQESMTHQEDKVVTIAIMSPVLYIPDDFDKKEALYEFLLDANHKLIVESFSISNQWLILSATYFLDDMRRQEVAQMLEALSYHAQYFIEILSEKFSLSY